MQKFLVLYRAPVGGVEEWMKIPEAERKPQEEKMMQEWDEWMKQHGSMFVEHAGAGKTKRVTESGVEDTKNDVMLYSIVEGESHEAVAEAFKDHPHFGIPDASIDIMPANPLRSDT